VSEFVCVCTSSASVCKPTITVTRISFNGKKRSILVSWIDCLTLCCFFSYGWVSLLSQCHDVRLYFCYHNDWSWHGYLPIYYIV
jgi:hypothetical protein